METLSVYVGAMPRMARDITVQALRDLGSAVHDAPEDPAALQGEPPILIVAWQDERLGDYERRVLAVAPQTVIIGFDWDGRRIATCELWPRRSPIGELSVNAIANAVHAAPSWDERFRD
ncbi:MAG TPA: hypothetical protein VFM58_18635 [Solirubrobacteraceae bacterium]|nr:hypothetical protein [Solirubrobacteraceae bacterium]